MIVQSARLAAILVIGVPPAKVGLRDLGALGWLNRHLYGRCCYKRGQGVYWARARELQKRGALNSHGLMGGPGLEHTRRLIWMDRWLEQGDDWCRIESSSISDGKQVRRYCSKYVTKGGQIDLGGTVVAWKGKAWPSLHAQGRAARRHPA